MRDDMSRSLLLLGGDLAGKAASGRPRNDLCRSLLLLRRDHGLRGFVVWAERRMFAKSAATKARSGGDAKCPNVTNVGAILLGLSGRGAGVGGHVRVGSAGAG